MGCLGPFCARVGNLSGDLGLLWHSDPFGTGGAVEEMSHMKKRTKLTVAAVTLVAAAATGGGVALAASHDDDTPITGEALKLASAAALAHTGGGEVTETEVGDEEGLYEVEVTRSDGSETDVHLDADFTVIEAVAEVDDAADEADD